MKVAIVVPYFTPFVRGNEFGLADGLSRAGVDVTILTSKGKAPREKMVTERTDVSQALSFTVKYLATPLDVKEIPLTPTVFWEVLKGGYDAVMLQEDYQPICHMAGLAAKIKGIPIVLSTERTFSPGGIKGLGLKIFDYTFNAFLRRTSTVYTAHCNAAKEAMERAPFAQKGKIKVINVGVDAALFKPTPGESPIKQGEFRILTVARLHEYKGLEYLLKAVLKLVEDVPGAYLYVMGRGPDAEKLKKLADDIELDGYVTFIESPVPNYEMPVVYSAADVYVQPSIQEPYGIAVLEAMACGKPVIGTRTGGMLDTIEDGVTGYLVPPKDPEAIAERLLQMAKDRDATNAMGYAARKRVENKFDRDVIAGQYLDILKTLTR